MASLIAIAGAGCGDGRDPEVAGIGETLAIGTIVPSAAVGTLPGRLDIGADGAATYEMPLWVPEGRAGVEPSLVLTYSSRGTNGPMGVGWSLSGFSAITQCRATWAVDGTNAPAETVPFCLDDGRLVAVAGSSIANVPAGCTVEGEYRTIPDSFARVIKCSNGPWYVYSKGGPILRYAARVTTAWLLDAVQDRNGNSMSMSYVAGTDRPSAIDYTGGPVAPTRRIELEYDARPDAMTRRDIEPNGNPVALTLAQRLKRIRVIAGGATIRTYELGYCEDPTKPQTCISPATQRSRLLSVRTCDGVSELGAKCLPPTTFRYMSDAPGANPWSGNPTEVSGTVGPSFTVGNPLFFADVNGDGRSDMLFYGGQRWYLRLSTGGDFAPAAEQVWGRSRGLVYDVNGDGATDLVIEGLDGRPAAYVWSPAAGRLVASQYVLPSAWRDPVTIADLAGDGVPRYIDRASSEQLEVYKNPFLGPNQPLDAPAVLASPWSLTFVRDLGGAPGFAFLRGAVTYNPLYTSRWRPDGTFYSGVGGRAPSPEEMGACPLWADFNGDGWLDVLNPTTGRLYALIEDRYTGGPSAYVFGTSVSWWSTPLAPLPACSEGAYQAADVNGDGRMDVLVLARSSARDATQRLRAMITRPDESGADEFTLSVPLYSPDDATSPKSTPRYAKGSRLIDINGDGAFDVFQLTSLTDFAVSIQRSSPNDLLVSVTDGLSRLDSVSYKALGNAPEFTRCWDPGCFEDAMFIATELALDDGNGGVARFKHSYESARVDRKGAGFLGFDVHAVTDLRTGAVTRTTYDNSRTAPGSTAGSVWYPHRGLPIEELAYVRDAASGEWNAARAASWNLVSTTNGGATYFSYSFTRQTRAYAGPAFEPTPAGTASPTFDCSSSPRCPGVTAAVDEIQSVDAFGNPIVAGRTRHVLTAGATGSFDDIVSTSYDAAANDPSRWLIGRATTTMATSAAPGSPTPPARTATFAYDAAGNLVEAEREPASIGGPLYQRTKLVRHPSSGVVTRVIVAPSRNDADPRARSSTIGYDPSFTYATSLATTTGNPAVPQLTTTSEVHTGLGVTLQSVDASGVPTSYDHDGFGRPRAVRDADGSTLSTTYVSAAAPHAVKLTTIGSDGFQAQTYLDSLGRVRRALTRGFDGTDAIVDTTYDAFGRVANVTRPHFASDPVRYAVAFGYDVLGRVTRIGHRDAPGTALEATTRVYSENQIFTYDEVGNPTVQELDGAGHLVRSLIAPNGSWLATTYQYGPFDELRRVTDPKQNVATFDYDAIGRRTDVTDGDIGHVHTTFDELDEVVAVTDAKNVTTGFAYDGIGRLGARAAPDGTDIFIWDTAPGAGRGRLARTQRADVSTSFGYDPFGRLENEHWQIAGESFDYDYAYDAQGRLETLAYPAKGTSGKRFTLQHYYNASGYLREIKDATNATSQTSIWSANTADAEGRLKQQTLGNSRITQHEYDPVSGLVSHVVTPGVHEMSYSYRANGTVQSRTDHLNAPSGFTSGPPPYSTPRTESFTYDSANRLATATVTGRLPATYTTTYDELGNVLSSDDQDACVDRVFGGPGHGPHQLARYTCFGTPQESSYDANGNETWAVAPDYREQTWTSFNKQLEVASRHGRMRYTYDANHDRVKKERVPGALSFMTEPETPALNDGLSGVWGTTIYAGGLFEKRTSSAPTIDHVYTVFAGAHAVAQLTWMQSKTDPAVGTDEWRYFHSDVQGTAERMTDASGALVEVQSLDAWGARRNPDWTHRGEVFPPQRTRRSYTGHESEDEFSDFLSGLIDMGGRSYDPFFKRFTSPDPWVQAPEYGPSWNRYSYVFNNPINLTDPTGYCAEPWDDCPWPPIIGPVDDGGGGGGAGGGGGGGDTPSCQGPDCYGQEGPSQPEGGPPWTQSPGTGGRPAIPLPKPGGPNEIGAAFEAASRASRTRNLIWRSGPCMDCRVLAAERGLPILGTEVIYGQRMHPSRTDVYTVVKSVRPTLEGYVMDGILYNPPGEPGLLEPDFLVSLLNPVEILGGKIAGTFVKGAGAVGGALAHSGESGVVDISTRSLTTAGEVAAVKTYAKATNAWLKKNGPVVIQSTKGELRAAANKFARAERDRAAAAGTPYLGKRAGHLPDTAVSGMADPPLGWLGMPGKSNSACGGVLGSRVGMVLKKFTVDGKRP